MLTGVPAIDVLVPVYNAQATLHESLLSVAKQSYDQFRVIVIDDGSTDASPQILDEWSQRDARFAVITQENAGIVAALNTGLAASSAPLIARMDADDLCDPNRFRKQVDFLHANPDTVAVSGRVEHIDENGKVLQGLPHPGDPDLADARWIPAREPYLIHPFLMARREPIIEVGGYRYVPNSEDSDLYWRLCERGRLVNLDSVLGQYRFHTGSISGSSIVGGRIMAVGSQLGAFAALQRARGERDDGFESDCVPLLKNARDLATMCEAVQQKLSPIDRPRFALAVGIKLLELAAYRPYEIERSDCEFLAECIRDSAALGLQDGNQKEINWYLSETAARLAGKGRARDAAILTPLKLWPKALAKAVRG